MVSAFILGIALLLGMIFILRWFVATDPKALVRAVKWVGLALVMVVVMWLFLSGKIWAAAAVLPAAMIWFARLFTGLRYIQMARRLFGMGRSPGWSNPNSTKGGGAKGGGANTQASTVRTRFVVMHLNHASAEVSGEVVEGRFAGQQLNDLTLDDLIDLLTEVQVDGDSARVVESYLDRRAPNWRSRTNKKQASQPPSGTMSRAEALRVLGLKDGASEADIKAAHRRLMAHVHPDHGGTDYLAQHINRARDVLLGD